MGEASIRMTLNTRAVLRAFLAEPAHPRYGLEIGSLTGLSSGTVHPILARLESIQWLTSDWEQIDSSVEGRPARRYYLISDEGLAPARQALAAADAARAKLTRLRPAEGF